ncbi:unnamed protein product, partial [marine sediment metagenome]
LISVHIAHTSEEALVTEKSFDRCRTVSQALRQGTSSKVWPQRLRAEATHHRILIINQPHLSKLARVAKAEPHSIV